MKRAKNACMGYWLSLALFDDLCFFHRVLFYLLHEQRDIEELSPYAKINLVTD